MKKYLKIVLLVIVAIILVGTFVFLYQKSRPKVVVYETLKPEVTDLQKTTVATGKVEPRDEILIKPQISGIIDEVYKEAGQAVRKGEVIAKVKVIPELGQLNSAESRVRLAEINATQAETDFSRVKKLYEDQLISREEYEKSEVAVKQAREEKQICGVKTIHHDIHTNGIIYLDMLFDVNSLSEYVPQISFLATLLGYMDTTEHTFREFDTETNFYSGGIGSDLNIYSLYNLEDVELKFDVKTKTFHQGGLSCAVLTHQGVDGAGPDGKGNAIQRLDTREFLCDIPHFQQCRLLHIAFTSYLRDSRGRPLTARSVRLGVRSTAG